MNSKTDILRQLHSQISVTGHIIGVAAGSGMTTKYSVKGGADFILALSAGRFRQSGRPSLASYLSYANSNEIVSDFATRELLSLIDEAPILFGLHATDPTIDLESYIAEIRMQGLAGIANFPTVGLIDGDFSPRPRGGRHSLRPRSRGHSHRARARTPHTRLRLR